MGRFRGRKWEKCNKITISKTKKFACTKLYFYVMHTLLWICIKIFLPLLKGEADIIGFQTLNKPYMQIINLTGHSVF